MRVELDLFSGRPNPSWELDEAGVREFERLMTRLKPGFATPEPPALGYRGFLLQAVSGVSRAYRGFVFMPQGVLDDPSCSIEWFLLDGLPAAFASLRRRVSAEITH
ncbi:MAG TPA: hypothetical protein VN814_21890 [Caulobacteraceae bacterium]|nr:hypothetical protein [Caulobacteraceae bacterium]